MWNNYSYLTKKYDSSFCVIFCYNQIVECQTAIYSMSKNYLDTYLTYFINRILSRRKNIFLTFLISFDSSESLLYCPRKKKIKNNKIFIKFWGFSWNHLIFQAKKLFGHLRFFIDNSSIFCQNLFNYTSFDRENISLHVGIAYNLKKYWWNLKIPLIPEVP